MIIHVELPSTSRIVVAPALGVKRNPDDDLVDSRRGNWQSRFACDRSALDTVFGHARLAAPAFDERRVV
jgi:hypothetical protein